MSKLSKYLRRKIGISDLSERLCKSLSTERISSANNINKKLLSSIKGASVSFAQCGEDLILRSVFKQLQISKPTYIDVGAHEPYYLNNTALFYMHGSTGINIEPNSLLFKEFPKHRPKDINLNIGISSSSGLLEFFIMDPPTLSTYIEDEAINLEAKEGHRIVKKIPVTTNTLTSVIEEYSAGKPPDLLSIDTEGLNLSILKTLDYDKYAPVVICVETLTYSSKGEGVKEKDLMDFMESNGYWLYADTYVNSIYVSQIIWNDVKSKR